MIKIIKTCFVIKNGIIDYVNYKKVYECKNEI